MSRSAYKRCAMGIKVLVLGSLLVFAACAPVVPVVWYKPGADQQDFNLDSYNCEKDMRQSGYYGSGVMGELNMEDFYRRCMVAHGWSTQVPAGSVPASQSQSLQGVWTGEMVGGPATQQVSLEIRSEKEVYLSADAPWWPSQGVRHRPVDVVEMTESRLKFTYLSRAPQGSTQTATVILDLKDGQLVGSRERPGDKKRYLKLTRSSK